MAIAALPRTNEPSVPETTIPYRSSIELSGMLMMLLGAWAAIVPFVGPLFGYNLDGSAAWTWNLSHTFLFLLPGGAAFLAGLMVMFEGAAGTTHRRSMLLLSGILAVAAGAWLVVGPIAWPVVDGIHAFGAASAFRTMTFWIGSALGPGALIVAMGAFVLGRPHPNLLTRSEFAHQMVEVRNVEDVEMD